jgi:integrase
MPKTRQARRVPIHPRLMTELQSYAAKLSKGRSYFFSDAADGARPINVRTINVDVQLLAKAFGVPTGRGGNGMVLHSLRHYFETQAVDSGIPQFVVDSWMGHSGQSLMGRHYYGMTDEKSHAFMKRVNF